jgi:hypothetical protein
VKKTVFLLVLILISFSITCFAGGFDVNGLGDSDFIIRYVYLQSSEEDAIRNLGYEYSYSGTASKHTLSYGRLDIDCKYHNILCMATDDPGDYTYRKIHVGSSLAEVREKYGENYYAVTSYNNLWLYEYDTYAYGQKDQHWILRFAVSQKTNLVFYWSIRNASL